MTFATFRVVTQGLQPGYPAGVAAGRLASLFKCSKEQIAPLLASKPVSVKKGLTQEAARKYAQALQNCGCLCKIEEESVPASAAPDQARKAAAPTAAAPLSQQQMLSVVPVLRPVVVRRTEPDPVVVQPFAGDVEVVFVTEPNHTVVRHSMLTASMTSVDKLYEQAVWNLYQQLHPRLTFKQMAVEGRARGKSGQRFFSYIETGDDLEASCLLLQPIWQSVAEETGLKGALRIAVPNAQTCLFCGADDAIAFAMMSDVASETWSESGAAALSALTYSVDASGRVSMVEGAHLQREGPRPSAARLTASAQLVAPRLHAEAEHAALLTLSEGRLRLLQPRLFDPAQWPREADRTEWLDNIRLVLARGDSRAAVVVEAASAIVACYTDELDCVALLQFDPALGQALKWQNGDRLLTANSYMRRDDGVARDLQPAPQDTGNWGNFWPLLADLLTDDQAGLAARKQQIPEAEWKRTWAFGRRALADGIVPRDGRPLGCSQPARERAGASAGKRATRSGHDQRAGTFGEFVKNAALFGLCALAAWGAGMHVAEMPRDGLFYIACFGIALFGALGLGSLWSAVSILSGA